MTAYFDDAHTRLQGLLEADLRGGPTTYSAIEEWEQKLVFDVTVCAEWPGCPEDIRDCIHETVLRHGLNTQPICAEVEQPNTEAAFADRLHKLVWDLHSVFHDLARRGVPGFSDSPTTPLRAIYAQGDARRTKVLCESGVRWFCSGCGQVQTNVPSGVPGLCRECT